MNTQVQLAGRNFNHCLMNAAGIYCMTVDELTQLVHSKATTFVTKTATLEARTGNPEPRYYGYNQNSINSMGLPNLGLEYYLEFLASEDEATAQTRFLSIAPLHPNDLPVLLTKIKDARFRGIVELNLSCPNVPGKPQIGYDFEQSQSMLETAFSIYDGPLGVKLPPYFDLVHFDQMAKILNQFPLSFINSVNSIGNGIVLEGNKMVIHPKQGFGGIGGPAIKATALANVHAFYQRLNPSIQIIGTGGVTSGRDIYEHILCGASLVQVGTTLYEEGPQVFERLIGELAEEMTKNGYQSFDDFRGKVEYIL